MGLTTSGSIGAPPAKTLDDSVRDVQGIVDASKSLRDDVLVLCHGGPSPCPMTHIVCSAVLKGIDGSLPASSMERLPTEVAITAQIREFGKVSLKR